MNMQALLAKKLFKRFEGPPFEVEICGESFTVGDGPPRFKIVLKKPIPYSDIIKSPTLALGEAYMRGDLEIEGELYSALDEFFRCSGVFTEDTEALKDLLYTGTDKETQMREVCSHYDLGNDFYRLWLGETMNYSCAYFENSGDSLDTAQRNKNRYILRKLNLKPGMTLLDIGCGWGSLIADAAETFGAKCVGITLSEEQYKGCKDLFEKKGICGRAEVHRMDYRELKSLGRQFDRIVSVGMLEHVGRPNYPLFMDNVSSAVKKGGLVLLHYISSLTESPGDAWIKKYIFPGGVIPSLREIIHLSSERDFRVLDVESLRRHYVRTLLCWYDGFEKHIQKIAPRFGEKFVRMWRLYLCACAAGFNNGIVDLHQVLFSNGINNDLPMTRKYLYT